jgi:hypothetical protein
MSSTTMDAASLCMLTPSVKQLSRDDQQSIDYESLRLFLRQFTPDLQVSTVAINSDCGVFDSA